MQKINNSKSNKQNRQKNTLKQTKDSRINSNKPKPGQSPTKKPPLRKNVSQKIPNGTLIITNDKYFEETDGESDKTRMSTVVDSNRCDELALTKYTKSKQHGKKFKNDKGFIGHGDRIYSKDNEGNPIKIDGKKFVKGNPKRTISKKQVDLIKKRNLTESKYKNKSKIALRNLKGRQKNKDR